MERWGIIVKNIKFTSIFKIKKKIKEKREFSSKMVFDGIDFVFMASIKNK